MEDPKIINFTKPANPEDIADLTPFKFSEYDDYTIGYTVLGDEIPPEVGTLLAAVENI